MKILLCGINAKFIHQNLAIYSIKKYCESKGMEDIHCYESSINNSVDKVISDIYLEKADVIGFSKYIWNADFIDKVIEVIRVICPNTKIILGGPESSYNLDETSYNRSVDYYVLGEGEKPFYTLLEYLNGNLKEEDLHGVATYNNEVITYNQGEICELSEIPFVYDDLSIFDNRIIYYESSRGCPFNCEYCLSSSFKGVRFLELNRVYSDLTFFLENKVSQVKFVDRTFNANPKNSRSIWEFLIQNDNGITNFHFEISADLLTLECFEVLKKARKGLFQFEVGVQSTNDETVKSISRSQNFKEVSTSILTINELQNIHLHLDLIVGLPYEGFESFRKSFNDVHKLLPEQLQVGFLKILKGSLLYDKAKDFGLMYRSFAPFEVYSTKWLSYDEYFKLKLVEEMVEKYYNSALLFNTISYITKNVDDIFCLYLELSEFYFDNGYFDKPNKKQTEYKIFIQYISKSKFFTPEILSLIKFDFLLNEKPTNLPEELGEINNELLWDIINDEEKIKLFDNLSEEINKKQIARSFCAATFDYNILELLQNKVVKMKYTMCIGNVYGKKATYFEVI